MIFRFLLIVLFLYYGVLADPGSGVSLAGPGSGVSLAGPGLDEPPSDAEPLSAPDAAPLSAPDAEPLLVPESEPL